MKHLIYLLFLVSIVSFGQDGFIEVEVRDSIRLTPLSFKYTVSISDSNLYSLDISEEFDYSKNKQKTIDQTAELKYLLTKKGYEFKELNESSYEINNSPYLSQNGFVLNLKSKEELEKLSSDLKVLDFIQGAISDTTYENSDLSEARLIKKLINKAKVKAQTIAELSNLQLGKIIEFKEVKEIDNMSFSLMDLYIMAEQRSSFNRTDEDIRGTKYKAIVIKFMAQ